jgi:hypothetical protein
MDEHEQEHCKPLWKPERVVRTPRLHTPQRTLTSSRGRVLLLLSSPEVDQIDLGRGRLNIGREFDIR